jgi:DNA-binding GntR family transcriptional regulator
MNSDASVSVYSNSEKRLEERQKERKLDAHSMDGPLLRPFKRVSLHAELLERLRDLIIEGTLAPGSKINELQLCQKLGVSRTPLREAIKSLSSEGLIELVAGRGALIKTLSRRDVQEMLAVLSTLEVMAGRLACRNATKKQIEHLRTLHDKMMGCYKQGDRLEYYKHNQAIHSLIVQLSGSQFLASLHDTIQSRLKRIRFLGNEEPAEWQGAVAEHQEMIKAFEAQNEDHLVAVLARHLERTWDRVQSVL